MADAPTSTSALALTPPLPTHGQEAQRREHVRKRVRMLSGEWFGDLQLHMGQHFDPVRERIVGKPDISTNVFRSVVRQLSVLYAEPAVYHHDDAAAAEFVTAWLAEAGWASLAVRLQQLVLGLNETFVRPHLTKRGLLLRLVTPDYVVASGHPDAPDEPHYILEARTRVVDAVEDWYHDELDVRDPENPTYRVLHAVSGEDLTVQILGAAASGDAYPFRLADGVPIIPYAAYHAERTGKLWNWREGAEAVEGTLTIAVLWSWWLHNVRDTAWAQRHMTDVDLVGGDVSGTIKNKARSIPADPSMIMRFRSVGDHPNVGQWNPPVDPKVLGQAIGEFERRLLVHFDLSPADLERVHGSAQSGYAIALRHDSVRAAQRKYVPQFRRGDEHLLRILSAFSNASESAMKIPADGWRTMYPGSPRTPQEVAASLEKHQILIDAGLESRVDAYLDLHPELSRAQAVAALQRIAQENRALA